MNLVVRYYIKYNLHQPYNCIFCFNIQLYQLIPSFLNVQITAVYTELSLLYGDPCTAQMNKNVDYSDCSIQFLVCFNLNEKLLE